MEKKVVLITGASSGFGEAAAALLVKNGYTVFGTSRKPEGTNSHGYAMLKLDVCSDDSVHDCIQNVMKRAGRIDVLVNNAGYELVGALEETTIHEAKSQFETNLFGVARMVKAVLPIMRGQQSGQIINVGSLTGLLALPFCGYYSASKYALEGYTEALRHEVKHFKIKVSIVDPSFFKTNLGKSSQLSAERISDYSRMRLEVFNHFKKSEQTGEDPIIVANLIQSIIESNRPKLRYRIGKDAVWRPRLRAMMPNDLFEAVFRKSFRLDQLNN